MFRKTESGVAEALVGNVDVYQYSGKQYELGGPANNPYPVKAEEPSHFVIEKDKNKSIVLPEYSLTIVRGIGPS